MDTGTIPRSIPDIPVVRTIGMRLDPYVRTSSAGDVYMYVCVVRWCVRSVRCCIQNTNNISVNHPIVQMKNIIVMNISFLCDSLCTARGVSIAHDDQYEEDVDSYTNHDVVEQAFAVCMRMYMYVLVL